MIKIHGFSQFFLQVPLLFVCLDLFGFVSVYLFLRSERSLFGYEF